MRTHFRSTFALIASILLAAEQHAIAADQYAAIAYSVSKHTYGYSYKYGSKAAADQAAVRYCDVPDAKMVVWTRNQWCALALDLDGNARGWGWHATASGAKQNALAECEKLCENSYVAICVSASGQVMEYTAPITPLALMPKAKDLPKLPESFFPSTLP